MTAVAAPTIHTGIYVSIVWIKILVRRSAPSLFAMDGGKQSCAMIELLFNHVEVVLGVLSAWLSQHFVRLIVAASCTSENNYTRQPKEYCYY